MTNLHYQQLNLKTPKQTHKQILSKQLEQKQNQRNGDHVEGWLSVGRERGRGRIVGGSTGNKKHNW